MGSDDEDEAGEDEDGGIDPVDAVPKSRARALRTEEEEIQDEEDEIDELERNDTTALLFTENSTVASGKTMVVDSTGLDAETAARVFWKKGRADLREVLQGDLESTEGPVNVTGMFSKKGIGSWNKR